MQNFLYTLSVGILTPNTEHHRALGWVYKLARATFILAQNLLMVSAWSFFTLMNNNVPSANRRCEMPGTSTNTQSHSVPWFTSCCNSLDNPSATKIKRSRDNGSPCRRTRVGLNGASGTLLNGGNTLHNPPNPFTLKA
jgi:hypothetical protein